MDTRRSRCGIFGTYIGKGLRSVLHIHACASIFAFSLHPISHAGYDNIFVHVVSGIWSCINCIIMCNYINYIHVYLAQYICTPMQVSWDGKLTSAY